MNTHDKTTREIRREDIRLTNKYNANPTQLNREKGDEFVKIVWRPVSVCEQREKEYKQKVKEAFKNCVTIWDYHKVFTELGLEDK